MDANSFTPSAPEVVVQIVHIEGPRKGQIDEFREFPVTIGRDPSSNVVFPKEVRIVSRKHAEIHREGNRFHLVNRSPNGCLVNGQPVDEAYLKQGDVLAFAQGGPKVSFLYSVQAGARPRQPGAAAGVAVAPPVQPQPRTPERSRVSTAQHPPAKPAERSRPAAAPPPESAAFTLQFGTSIKSFKQPCVRIGREESCDFPMGDPRVFGTHAEIYYRLGQYYLRDLTQSEATLLNGRAITADTPLQENDILGFSQGGPKLRYLGSGRLAEVIEAPAEERRPAAQAAPPTPGDGMVRDEASLANRVRSLFRK